MSARAGGGGKHEVGQRLAEGDARHGGRVHQALQGLLADGGGRPRQAGVRLGHDRHVRHRQLQRPAALLLRHQACRVRMLVSQPGQHGSRSFASPPHTAPQAELPRHVLNTPQRLFSILPERMRRYA